MTNGIIKGEYYSMTIQDLRNYLSKQENAPNFDELLSDMETLVKLVNNLGNVNDYEFPYAIPPIINEATKLRKIT